MRRRLVPDAGVGRAERDLGLGDRVDEGRDGLPHQPEHRRGVPDDRAAHALGVVGLDQRQALDLERQRGLDGVREGLEVCDEGHLLGLGLV